MSDNNLEDEFKSYFGDDNSLFRKLGEEKAKKVLTLVKQMLTTDDDLNKIFQPSPFKKLPSKNSDEPDEIIETNDNGVKTIKKIWKDENGKTVKTQIESKIEINPISSDIKPFDVDFIFKDIPFIPTNLGLPMVIDLNMGNNSFDDFIKKFRSTSIKKKERTLEDLLNKAVEIENYDLAADVKKLIEYSPEFLEAFKRDMAEATEKEDMSEIKKLTGIFEKHKMDIQKLLDDCEDLFNE